jgi:hypothetical protein
MALSEFEQKRCERIVGAFIEKRRPAAHIRDKLDLGFPLRTKAWTFSRSDRSGTGRR